MSHAIASLASFLIHTRSHRRATPVRRHRSAVPSPSDAACLPAGSAVVVFGGGSRGGRSGIAEGDVEGPGGSVVRRGLTARRARGRRLTADPRAAPVLSRAPRRRGRGGSPADSGRRHRDAAPVAASHGRRGFCSTWNSGSSGRLFAGVGHASAAPWSGHASARSLDRVHAQGPSDVPRGTSGDRPARRAARPPREVGRGPSDAHDPGDSPVSHLRCIEQAAWSCLPA